jgi:farnesyl diphosphate synthase
VDELEFMHIHKTGALIRAAVLLGAHCGEADDTTLQALGHYANRSGLLFQVVDDILDAESTTATLGKTAGKDAANNKPTYVNILGAREAKAMSSKLKQDAHDALEPFGESALRLHELADFIVERTF